MRRISFQNIILILGIVLGVVIIFLLLSIEITSQPQFCGFCHVMKPYVRSWQTSTHRNVACVECHIPPGITSEFRKKFEALSMVTKYITGTYGTNPWTEIEDRSCLRCHEKRLLQGKELFNGVLFDHAPHLLELRRGEQLKCTSCHSQIVQGTHIAVTTFTCFICHFKNQELGKGTASCTLCHEIPEKTIIKAGVNFDHSEVKKFGMDCMHCHRDVVRGEGEVFRERCLTCHNDPQRLEKFGDREFLHRLHVTEHKVECVDCHREIEHRVGEIVNRVNTNCETCHKEGHSLQKELYMGIGGRGLNPQPDFMYLSGTRCEGCHFLPPKNEKETMEASEVSCMKCHGFRFKKIYNEWKEGIEKRLGEVKKEFEKSKPFLYKKGEDDILYNIEFVENAKAIHNIRYSTNLLIHSYSLIINELKARGIKLEENPYLKTIPYESYCLKCHIGIEIKESADAYKNFSHMKHVLENQINCQTCHPKHSGERLERKLLLGNNGCSKCHHTQNKECMNCHKSYPDVQFKGKIFSHSLHIKEMELLCIKCHSFDSLGRQILLKSVCAECH
ncbi:MAG: cytochrome c3 family protein [Candidatus Aminicenantia bacterium]